MTRVEGGGVRTSLKKIHKKQALTEVKNQEKHATTLVEEYTVTHELKCP